MTTQYDFTNDEWSAIASTPLLVGMAVAKAEDSGFFGSLKEARTLNASIAARVDDNPARSLIEAAAATDSRAATEAFDRYTPAILADTAVSACHELAGLLDRTAEPGEAAGFKAWVIDIARTVAEAAKEHGERTSAGEAALVDRITAALG